MTRRAKVATIREVAALAGVSTATVSRTLRNSANVDPATRLRVEQAAATLRYRPSGVARSLKLRSTRTLGLIVTDILNPYFPQIVRAIEDAARERGYSVLLADGRHDPSREIESLDLLADREVDGLIIASTAVSARHQDRIRELRCPVVIVNSESTIAGTPAVASDNVAGGRLAAEHLFALGHEHVAYVTTTYEENTAANDRFAGASAAHRARGRSAPLVTIVAVDGVEGGMWAAQRAMAEHPETTALLCYNDLTAVGAIRGLRAAGYEVPRDVSVMGFDDIEIAAYVDPALTTVRQATDEMGRSAVELLFARLEGGTDAAVSEPREGDTRRLPVQLIARASTAPPALAPPAART
jgi:DNA-binding LacI/PurR family transcriptional regulator